jgi:hypothetical protein
VSEFISAFSEELDRQPILGVIMLLVFFMAVCVLALVGIAVEGLLSWIF